MKREGDWLKERIPKIIGQTFCSGFVILCISYVFDAPSYLGITLFGQQYFGICFGLALSAIFLLYPPIKGSVKGSLPWYDALLATLSLITGLYVTVFYPSISFTIGVLTPARVILGAIFVIIILEAVRRTTGWVLLIIVGAFILYARYTHFAPGDLYGQGIPWDRLMSFLYLDPNALLGLVSKVTFGIVLPFILFGRLLFAAGGARFLTDLAMATMGRFRGGPAKVAVLGSGLFGTMSGSAVSDVATTGVITIPMMKKTGYKPEFAAAVEAVASSGGCILPPVMGAAAFLMAEFLEIPYTEVVKTALVPAIIYYMIVFLGVDLRAAKRNLQGLRPQELPSLRKTLAKGWFFFFPVMVLIYALFILDLTPGKAAIYAAASAIAVSSLRRETRAVFRNFYSVLVEAGQTTLALVAITGAAGLIIGIVAITGLGFSFSQLLIDISGGKLMTLLGLTAIGCIIMGMGLPITASYILVVTLGAPALVQAGTEPLAAHLFVLYFAVLSFITPPVCLAVYTASSIANSNVFSTALIGMRLGIVAYVIPFVFILDPAVILIKSSVTESLVAICGAAAGLAAIEVAWEGYLFSRCSWLERGLMLLGGIGLLMHFWIFKIVALGLIVILVVVSLPRVRTRLVPWRTGKQPASESSSANQF